MSPTSSPTTSVRTRVAAIGIVSIVSFCLRAVPVSAQDIASEAQPPAHLSVVDGIATLERDGALQAAAANTPLIPGDRLRTAAGRLEIVLPDGTILDVDQYSAVDLQGPALFRLTAGRIMLIVARALDPATASRYQIDTPAASARTDGPGEFRITVSGDRGGETELAVLRGTAALATERGSMPIRAGERVEARVGNDIPSFPRTFNTARDEGFDRWIAERRDARTSAVAPQYLPPDLRIYGGALDRNGSWEYDATYGDVWYPRVAAEWRPYYYGSWTTIAPYGRTWIGADAWAWPTHHYGRWGVSHSSRWFWIPGRTWRAAWVSWASAPGYVSWCPLGFDDRPVFPLSVAFHPERTAWTFVPRHSFDARARVDRFALHPHRIPVELSAWRQVPESTASRQPSVITAPAAASRQPAGIGHQSSSANRQSSLVGHQSAVVSPQPPVVDRQTSIGGHQVPVDAGRTIGIAVPRTIAPAAPVPTVADLAVAEFRRPLSAGTPALAIPRLAPGSGAPTPDAGRTTPALTLAPVGHSPSSGDRRPAIREPLPQAVPRWSAPGASAGPPIQAPEPPAQTYRVPGAEYRRPANDVRSPGSIAPTPAIERPSTGDARPATRDSNVAVPRGEASRGAASPAAAGQPAQPHSSNPGAAPGHTSSNGGRGGRG